MNKLSVSTFLLSLTVTSAPVFAQTVDQTQTLPDAQPGECYAKVVTPAKFETRTEEIVVQEGSQRIQTVAAAFESVDQRVMVREASRLLKPTPVTYADEFEKVETRPAEANWVMSVGKTSHPASPGALEGISASGVDIDTVAENVCFREYYTPAEYRTEDRRVLKRAGGETIEVTPAEFETAEERIVIKEASSRLVNVPAVYRTESESVLVEPARSVWKKGRGPLERIDDTTGEIMCLVEIPARYETVSRSVLESPSTTKTVDIPAVYKTGDATYSGREVCLVPRPAEFTTIKKQVVSAAAAVAVTEREAQFETVKVQRLITPASEKRTEIPRRVKTVTRQVQVAPPTLVWRRVLCETNVTVDIVTNLQKALAREGFDPGVVDGVLGGATLTAVKSYQEDNDLDVGGVTYETLKALKVQR